MITFYKNYFHSADSRGLIKGIINEGNWQEINYFETTKNQIRAEHYHKETDELFIILKGKIKITLEKIDNNGNRSSKKENYEIKKDDIFVISRMTYHVFEILENSIWINALSKKMDRTSPDIHSI